MKKLWLLIPGLSILWACATFQPAPPSFYIESLPQVVTTQMTLEERLKAEEVWTSIRTGNSAKAEKLLERLNPGNPVYELGRGYVAILLNDLPMAEQSFKTALESRPDLVVAYLGLAQVYEIQGTEDQVLAQYREVLKREPGHSWAKPRYEALRAKKTDSLLAEGKAALAAGQFEAGKRSLLKALFYDPASTEAHLELASAYRREKDYESALIHLQAASSLSPDDKNILKSYADTLYAAEQLGKSLDAYEKLREMDPRNKEVAARVERLKDRLGVFELPSLYNSIPASNAITREDLAALIAVKFKGVLDDSQVKPPIIIDISTSWASKFILKTASLDLLEVYDNHTFLPKKAINRAEFAEAMLRLVDFLSKKGYRFVPQVSPERIQISDVPPDSFFYRPITRIVAYQIMDLTPQRTFQPEAPVSGQEAGRTLDIVLALIK